MITRISERSAVKCAAEALQRFPEHAVLVGALRDSLRADGVLWEVRPPHKDGMSVDDLVSICPIDSRGRPLPEGFACKCPEQAATLAAQMLEVRASGIVSDRWKALNIPVPGAD